jgi:hypothetical protein
MTGARSNPDLITHYSRETLGWRFDFTRLLGEGESIASAVSHLIDLKTGMSYATPITASPTVASPFVTQIVATPRAGRYRFSVVGTVSASKAWEIPVVMEVPH